jgi:hypothetical protein
MDIEKTIIEIAWLEHIYMLPDDRPLRKAADRRPICGGPLANASPTPQCCSQVKFPDGQYREKQRRAVPHKLGRYLIRVVILVVLIFLLAYLLVR